MPLTFPSGKCLHSFPWHRTYISCFAKTVSKINRSVQEDGSSVSETSSSCANPVHRFYLISKFPDQFVSPLQTTLLRAQEFPRSSSRAHNNVLLDFSVLLRFPYEANLKQNFIVGFSDFLISSFRACAFLGFCQCEIRKVYSIQICVAESFDIFLLSCFLL